GWDRCHGLKRAVGQVRHDGRPRRERRNGLQRAEKSVRSPGPGGEVERIREAAAPAVAETQGPEVVLAERLTRSEFKHSFEGTVHRVEGIDPVVPAVVPDEQITAELAETLGRDGQSPGVVQPLACWVVDQRLDEGTVGLELIHDAARGNTLVRVR